VVSSGLNQTSINQLKQAYKIFMQKGDPMQILNQMSAQNPQLQSIVQMLNNGANPEIIFKNLCQAKGINAEEFINQLKE
jgi:hypothetical protein